METFLKACLISMPHPDAIIYLSTKVFNLHSCEFPKTFSLYKAVPHDLCIHSKIFAVKIWLRVSEKGRTLNIVRLLST